MNLQLWVGEAGHYFMDRFHDRWVQVGETFQRPDGSWSVEVNDNVLTAPDFESAKRLFVEKYDRSLVKLSPVSRDDEFEPVEGFFFVDLSRFER